MSRMIEQLEREYLAKRARYEEQDVYRNKLLDLKRDGLIQYQDVAIALDISGGYLSRFVSGKKNLGDVKFGELKELVHDIEAAAGLKEEE